MDGYVMERNDYYTFGKRHTSGRSYSSLASSPFLFSGKEDQSLAKRIADQDATASANLNFLNFGARHYDPVVPRWLTVDPLSEKYYNLNPYSYCAADPVTLIDPDGRVVKPSGKMALAIIKNTLPLEARQYIQLDNNGYIDVNAMMGYSGDSENFKSLLTLVNDPITISVTTLQETQYIYNDQIKTERFNQVLTYDDFVDTGFSSCSGNTTGECGNLGVTYMPTDRKDGKVDAIDPKSIHININPSLSPVGAAETFSHEGYGHALIYVETSGNREKAVHHYDGQKETNQTLIDKSINARKETIKNMGL